jgi:hypothetical protein
MSAVISSLERPGFEGKSNNLGSPAQVIHQDCTFCAQPPEAELQTITSTKSAMVKRAMHNSSKAEAIHVGGVSTQGRLRIAKRLLWRGWSVWGKQENVES